MSGCAAANSQILFLRHGQAISNAQLHFDTKGQKDPNPELSETGMQMTFSAGQLYALHIFEQLRKNYGGNIGGGGAGEDVKFLASCDPRPYLVQTVVISPTLRTIQTADQFFKGISAQLQKAGLPPLQIKRSCKEVYATNPNAWCVQVVRDHRITEESPLGFGEYTEYDANKFDTYDPDSKFDVKYAGKVDKYVEEALAGGSKKQTKSDHSYGQPVRMTEDPDPDNKGYWKEEHWQEIAWLSEATWTQKHKQEPQQSNADEYYASSKVWEPHSDKRQLIKDIIAELREDGVCGDTPSHKVMFVTHGIFLSGLAGDYLESGGCYDVWLGGAPRLSVYEYDGKSKQSMSHCVRSREETRTPNMQGRGLSESYRQRALAGKEDKLISMPLRLETADLQPVGMGLPAMEALDVNQPFRFRELFARDEDYLVPDRGATLSNVSQLSRRNQVWRKKVKAADPDLWIELQQSEATGGMGEMNGKALRQTAHEQVCEHGRQANGDSGGQTTPHDRVIEMKATPCCCIS